MTHISNTPVKYKWNLILEDSDRHSGDFCLKLFKTKAEAQYFATQEINKYLITTAHKMTDEDKEQYIDFAKTACIGAKLNFDPITIEEFGTSAYILSEYAYHYDNTNLGLSVILKENDNDNDNTFYMDYIKY
jgi:hypothetical protein